MEDEVSTQYGVRYPDGTEDWTVNSWFGLVDDGVSQDQFKHQWVIRMQNQGIQATPEDADQIKFLRRTVQKVYSNLQDITDTEYIPMEVPQA